MPVDSFLLSSVAIPTPPLWWGGDPPLLDLFEVRVPVPGPTIATSHRKRTGRRWRPWPRDCSHCWEPRHQCATVEVSATGVQSWREVPTPGL